MSLDRYSEAALPDGYTVLGVPLRPFSLGHELLLARARSPFVIPAEADRLPGLADLLIAVFVCSRDFSTARKALARRLPAAWKLFAWGVTALISQRPAIILRHASRFRSYLADAGSRPVAWQPRDRSGRPSGIPELAAVKLTLLRAGYTAAEVLDMPRQQAVHEAMYALAREGAIELQTEDEAAALAQLREQKAAA